MTTLPTLLAELRRYATALAGDEWQLQDGCSWRRIGSGSKDGNVLCPTKHHIDGHPDLSAAENVLAYIIKAQPNHILALLAHIDALEVDARRYRWLRDPTNQPDDVEGPGGTIIVQAGYLGDETILTGTELDAALDAALAEQGEPK